MLSARRGAYSLPPGSRVCLWAQLLPQRRRRRIRLNQAESDNGVRRARSHRISMSAPPTAMAAPHAYGGRRWAQTREGMPSRAAAAAPPAASYA